MFSALADYVKLNVASVTTRITGMVAMVVPFLIAATFGVAAIYIAISNHYSELTAAIALAIAFAVIGLIMVGVFAAQRRHQETLKQEALTQARRSFAASALMLQSGVAAGSGARRVSRRAAGAPA